MRDWDEKEATVKPCERCIHIKSRLPCVSLDIQFGKKFPIIALTAKDTDHDSK